MFVTKHPDTFAAFPNRCVEQGRNAKRLEVTFCQAACGRVRQDVVGDNRPFSGQLLKIFRVLGEAKPAAFELLIETIFVTQIQDFTRDSGIIFQHRPVTDASHIKCCGRYRADSLKCSVEIGFIGLR